MCVNDGDNAILKFTNAMHAILYSRDKSTTTGPTMSNGYDDKQIRWPSYNASSFVKMKYSWKKSPCTSAATRYWRKYASHTFLSRFFPIHSYCTQLDNLPFCISATNLTRSDFRALYSTSGVARTYTISYTNNCVNGVHSSRAYVLSSRRGPRARQPPKLLQQQSSFGSRVIGSLLRAWRSFGYYQCVNWLADAGRRRRCRPSRTLQSTQLREMPHWPVASKYVGFWLFQRDIVAILR